MTVKGKEYDCLHKHSAFSCVFILGLTVTDSLKMSAHAQTKNMGSDLTTMPLWAKGENYD